MNDKDLDLLLSLIEGRLSAGDDAAARSRLSQDPELRNELDMQRLAVVRLQRLPQPSMTATERERLHGALRRELHLSPVAATEAPRSRFWARWAPISGVAVAALLLAGIVYVVPRTGDQADTASDVFAADVLETTTPGSENAAEAPAPGAQGADAAAETDPGTSGASPDAAADSPSDEGATAAPEQSGEGESRSLDTAGADQGDPADAPEAAPETENATVFVDPGDDGTDVADVADEETTETTAGETASGDGMLIGSLAGGVPSAEELMASLGSRVEDRQSVIDYFMSRGSVSVDARNTQACAATLDSVGEGREAVPVAAGPGGEVLLFAFFETADWPFTIALVAADGCRVMGSATPGT
jgi:hypothetical protein